MTLRLCILSWCFCCALTAAFVAVPVAEAARGERWVRITQHRIDTQQGEELIDLRDARGSFVAFRLRARRGRLGIEHFTVNFHDKTSYTSEQGFVLRSGERTKVLARGDDDVERFPETLSVAYQKDYRSGRNARLEVWGLQTREGRNAERPEKIMPVPPPPPRVGQAEIGSDGSVLISVKTLGRETAAETIDVADKIGKFKRLRLAVREAPIEIEKLSVTFKDGTKDEFVVNGTMKQNSGSPWFDIDASKFIKNVGFTLREKTSLSSPPVIELQGQLADGWLSANGEGKSFNDGWVLLGAQSAGFIGFDNDVIPVSSEQSGYEKLRVNVLGRSVTLNQIRVVYADGEEDIVPVRTRIDDGDVFGPIDLRGHDQKIREIQARYRSRVIDKITGMQEAALVQVWGKR